jgi:NAD-dependent SIR2 family protein deacetylase
LDELIELFNAHNLKSKSLNFGFEELCQGLKEEEFKKIVIITGAGISVAAGIPDFRSSGGLYDELGKKYGCGTPEELMTLDKFINHPEILYSIMNEFMKHDVRPFDC